MNQSLAKRLVAEAIGTALLLAAVVGSGIMGERLSGGNVAIALLANTISTGAALVALILAFGPISGAHFNPAITLADAWQKGISWRETPSYIAAQIVGAFAGVACANFMFGLPVLFASQHARTGFAQRFSEFIATFGLLAVIWGCARTRSAAVPFAVAAYITAAYWFTASTSFANPAVTLARSMSDTFAGIRPIDVPGFIVAQLLGAATATLLFRWLASPLHAYKVLFLCTGNSARSIFAEYLLRRAGGDRFEVYSAGSFPTGKVNPFAIEVLRDVYRIDASAARSKSWEEFGDLEFDFVITVCDNARESCPIWPGHPIVEHWSIPDPALVEGSDEEKLGEFKRAARTLAHRIDLFCESHPQITQR